MPALDYDEIAKFYDYYVATDYDHAFWLKVCRDAATPCLELMCGTGRISMHLLRDGNEEENREVQRRSLAVRFHLINPDELRRILHRAGFEIVQEFGSYEWETYNRHTSPFYNCAMQGSGAISDTEIHNGWLID